LSESTTCLQRRLTVLERRLRLHRIAFGLLIGIFILVAARPRADQQAPVELRVKGIIVEDEAGQARIVLGPLGERMHGEAFGIAINDAAGAERFGVSHFSDERIVMGFDAPPGVGNPMRDRLGLGVAGNGHPFFMMLNNDTTSPLRMYTTDDNEARVEFIDWDRSGESPRVVGYKRYGIEEEYVPE
jgi:hypothetical protein